MKKIIKLIMLMLFLIPLTVKADMGAPFIKEYVAIVDKVGGADYYETNQNGKLEKAGTLDYNEEITIIFEDGANNEYHGQFQINDEYYYINLDDITAKEENVTLDEEYKCVTEKKEGEYKSCYTLNENLVLKEEGIKMYKGPAYGYEVIQSIPKDTVLKYEYASESDLWYYTEYNGVKGWVCELDGNIGTEITNKKMTVVDMDIYNKSIGGDSLGKIKANTIIDEGYETDPWTRMILVTYNGITGYIDGWYLADYREKTTTKLESSYMVESLDLENKKVLIEEIPAGTEITYNYGYEYRPAWFIYTTIGDKTGWVCEDMCDELEESLSNSDASITPTTTTTTTTSVNTITENSSKTLPGNIIVILCVASAIIVALTATVTVLLVNKNKKSKVEEKVNIEENNDEKKE